MITITPIDLSRLPVQRYIVEAPDRDAAWIR